MTALSLSEESEPTEVVFCIGSNCGDKEENVDLALKWMAGLLCDFRHSHIYATPDCHGGQREYMNAVAIGRSTLLPDELNRRCKEYELQCGRDEDARKAGDVPVDVDLVVYGDKVLRAKDYKCEFFQNGFKSLSV